MNDLQPCISQLWLLKGVLGQSQLLQPCGGSLAPKAMTQGPPPTRSAVRGQGHHPGPVVAVPQRVHDPDVHPAPADRRAACAPAPPGPHALPRLAVGAHTQLRCPVVRSARAGRVPARACAAYFLTSYQQPALACDVHLVAHCRDPALRRHLRPAQGPCHRKPCALHRAQLADAGGRARRPELRLAGQPGGGAAVPEQPAGVQPARAAHRAALRRVLTAAGGAGWGRGGLQPGTARRAAGLGAARLERRRPRGAYGLTRQRECCQAVLCIPQSQLPRNAFVRSGGAQSSLRCGQARPPFRARSARGCRGRRGRTVSGCPRALLSVEARPLELAACMLAARQSCLWQVSAVCPACILTGSPAGTSATAGAKL